MKLIDIVADIDQLDEELVIFMENINDINSEVILTIVPESEQFSLEIKMNEKAYFYLLEIFIAKEFLEGWLTDLHHRPSLEEITSRLHYYGLHDA